MKIQRKGVAESFRCAFYGVIGGYMKQRRRFGTFASHFSRIDRFFP